MSFESPNRHFLTLDESTGSTSVFENIPGPQPSLLLADLNTSDMADACFKAQYLLRMSPEVKEIIPGSRRQSNGVVLDYHPYADLSTADRAVEWGRAVRQTGTELGTPMLIESTARGGGATLVVLVHPNPPFEAVRLVEAATGWNAWMCPEASPILGSRVESKPWDVSRLLEAHPEAPAVREGNFTVTYGQLAHASAQVARRLRSIDAEGPVLIQGRRDARTVGAILGCWAAGLAWCAVDPMSSGPRYNHLLKHIRPAVILNCDDIEFSSEYSDGALATISMPAESTAYLVASSGSTGTPKIAALPSGGLEPLLNAWKSLYHLDRPQTVCQIGSLDGDVFLGDMLKALVSNGCLVIVPDKDRADPEIVAVTISNGCTFFESTPVMVRAVLSELDHRDLCWPETVVVGSDTLRVEEARELTSINGDRTRILNGFGTTECMIESVVFDFAALTASHRGHCPIGAPLPGVETTVVDATCQPVPRGDVGALVVNSPGVALGYYEHGQLRRRKRGAWFATGDLASVGEDNQIQNHGRHDSMVKVRGYRVEIGEVENVLLCIPGIAEAHVISFRRAGATELAAFVSGGASGAETVRQLVSDVLPEYAVPAVINVLPQLPRLPTGKLDRLEMAALLKSSDDLGEIPTALDDRVAYAWRAVLGREASSEATFFDQGGTSVLLLSLATRLRDVLGEEHQFSVADLFQYPDISSFTRMLRMRSAGPGGSHGSSAVRQPHLADSSRLAVLRQVAEGKVSTAEARQRLSTT